MILLQGIAAGDSDQRPDAVKSARYYLKPGVYSAGRAEGISTILLQDDPSISRDHATVTVYSLSEAEANGGHLALVRGKQPSFAAAALHASLLIPTQA